MYWRDGSRTESPNSSVRRSGRRLSNVPHQAQDEEKDASTARSRRPVPCRDSSPQGTFVAALKITQDLKELSGFVEDMHALGRKPTCADKRRARRQNSSCAPGRRRSPLLRRDLPTLRDRQEDHHQQSEGRAHFFHSLNANTMFR